MDNLMQIQYNTLNSSATLHIRYIVSSYAPLGEIA